MTQVIRDLVLSRADGATLQRQALEEGMESMQRYGVRKAAAAETTLEEVLRVTRD